MTSFDLEEFKNLNFVGLYKKIIDSIKSLCEYNIYTGIKWEDY
jgi:hypothetical protein